MQQLKALNMRTVCTKCGSVLAGANRLQSRKRTKDDWEKLWYWRPGHELTDKVFAPRKFETATFTISRNSFVPQLKWYLILPTCMFSSILWCDWKSTILFKLRYGHFVRRYKMKWANLLRFAVPTNFPACDDCTSYKDRLWGFKRYWAIAIQRFIIKKQQQVARDQWGRLVLLSHQNNPTSSKRPVGTFISCYIIQEAQQVAKDRQWGLVFLLYHQSSPTSSKRPTVGTFYPCYNIKVARDQQKEFIFLLYHRQNSTSINLGTNSGDCYC